jgi:hypothetical protein
MQRMAFRAAADAERYMALEVARLGISALWNRFGA